jgi:hypothetical protein
MTGYCSFLFREQSHWTESGTQFSEGKILKTVAWKQAIGPMENK